MSGKKSLTLFILCVSCDALPPLNSVDGALCLFESV